MNSRQRVQAAIEHREPDRVPVNYLCNPGIDRRLKDHFGLEPDDSEGLRQALGVDFRQANARYAGAKLHADPPGMTADVWGIRRRWVEHEAGGYWDFCDWPLREATVEQIDAWALPDPDDYDTTGVADACRRYDDYYIVAGSPGVGDNINTCGMLRTMQQVLIDLATDDPAGLRLMDRRNDVDLAVTRRTLEAGDGRIDMLWIGEDLGTQRGPTISPATFRKHIRPRLQRFVDLADEFGIPTMIHSCGSSSWAFDDFVEMGIRAADTLQPEAKDMAPSYLKGRWGERLAFHGMISTAGAVTYGQPADVVADVQRTLEVTKPGGGYCLAPTHQLQDNSPTENVLAMYEAARELGVY